MKIKFESEDDLPLGKTFNIPDMIIVITSALGKNSKYYRQIFCMNARISCKNATIRKN